MRILHFPPPGKCSFAKIAEHLNNQADLKKQMTSEQKKAAKAEKDRLEEPFAFAVVDGRKEKLGNFRVEPPGLFRGRGQHPKMGKLKARVVPEDITLNMSKGAKVPEVPDIGDGKKHEWGDVVHKNTVTWLAKWKDSINGEDKCVWLSANSSWKRQSDKAKYEKARELKKHIAKVRDCGHVTTLEELDSSLHHQQCISKALGWRIRNVGIFRPADEA